MIITKFTDTNSLKVYVTHTDNHWDEITYNNLLLQLPVFVQSRIIKYQNWKDRQLRILGKLLLKQLLTDFGMHHLTSLQTLEFSDHNRPYFMDNFDFSISHSGDKVICAASIKNRLGVDIELMRDIDPVELLCFLDTSDIVLLKNSNDPIPLFYQLWTRKEAIAKASGFGVIESFEIENVKNNRRDVPNTNYVIEDLIIDSNYKGALVVGSEI